MADFISSDRTRKGLIELSSSGKFSIIIITLKIFNYSKNDHEKLSVVSFSRGLERGENTSIRPLSQLLVKRKFYQPASLAYKSQNKIEIITNSNFVIRKHCPVANPFKDYPYFKPESFVVHKRRECPKRVFNYLQKKSATVKTKEVARSRTSVGRIKREGTFDAERISGWIGFRDGL